MGRRVLITGLGTFWGGRVAQALEADPSVDVIVGLDRKEPTVQLERTEYVRSDESYSILARIVKAAQIDTIVHTFLVVDSTQMKSRTIHEINVIGTMNLFAAASAPGSTVRNVVVKSSTLVYGAHPKDPVWFSEETRRRQPPKAMVERSLLEVEGYVRDFAVDNPHVNVAMLRFSNVLGPDITTPLAKALELPLVPSRARLRPALPVRARGRRGAGDPVRARGPGAGHLQRRRRRAAPVERGGRDLRQAHLPAAAVRHGAAVGAARPARRRAAARSCSTCCATAAGVDNRRLKQVGFDYRYTSAGTVADFVEALRIRNMVGSSETAYQYERDVEQFFRHSPAVVREPAD